MTTTVVLVPPAGSWDAPALTIEVARGLAASLPAAVAITWWAPGAEDAWLAAHDLTATGLAGRVAVARDTTPPPATVTVHTGLAALDGRSADHGRPDRSSAVGIGRDGVGPFAVEDLVAVVSGMVADATDV